MLNLILQDFEALADANEDGALTTFLRLSDPPTETTRPTTNGCVLKLSNCFGCITYH